MVASTGFEPVTYRLSSDCSAIELRGYNGRTGGSCTPNASFEVQIYSLVCPTDMHLIPILEGGIGFAPMMRGLQPRALVCLANHPYGAEKRTWTSNTLITGQLLCQLSYLGMPGIRDYSDEIR